MMPHQGCFGRGWTYMVSVFWSAGACNQIRNGNILFIVLDGYFNQRCNIFFDSCLIEDVE
jgi:hypothetical protein